MDENISLENRLKEMKMQYLNMMDQVVKVKNELETKQADLNHKHSATVAVAQAARYEHKMWSIKLQNSN